MREYANLPWGQVHLRRLRGGDRPLVLLHQAPSSSEMWEPVIGLFADRGYAVTAIDLPGHGMSDPPPHEPDLQWYGEAVRGVLDAIGFESVRIVGHHTGASVALRLAADAPGRVAALALWGIPLLDPAYAHRLATEDPPDYDEAGKFLTDQWAFWLQRSTPECRPAVCVRAIKEALLAGRCRPYGHRAVGRADHRALLEAVSCPVLGLAGTRETLVQQTQDAVALLRNGTYVELGDTGIDVADQIPERFVDEIDTFFRQTRSTRLAAASP
jgi:pimeloyl-ACP methyl ester carboxylesterase